MTSIPYKSFISSGWHTFKKHWKFVILAALATAFVQFILNALQNGADRSGWFIGLVISVFAGIVGIVITLGWTRVLLALNRNDSADWDTFKTDSKIWLHYIKVMIWYALYFIMWAVPVVIIPAILALIGFLTGVNWLMTVGMVLAGIAFVIVAIYFAVRYQFVNFVLLDSVGLRSKSIFKKSGEMTKGYFWQLVALGALLLLLNLLGLLCLGVGLLVTIPVSKLAQARAYDFLKGKKGGHTDVVVRSEEITAPSL